MPTRGDERQDKILACHGVCLGDPRFPSDPLTIITLRCSAKHQPKTPARRLRSQWLSALASPRPTRPAENGWTSRCPGKSVAECRLGHAVRLVMSATWKLGAAAVKSPSRFQSLRAGTFLRPGYSARAAGAIVGSGPLPAPVIDVIEQQAGGLVTGHNKCLARNNKS